MNKGIILSVVASSILSIGVTAETLEDRLHKLESQMQTLAKENVILKSSIKNNIKEGSAIDPEEIEELDERLGEIEMRSFSDRIQFGIGFKTRVENFKHEMSDGSSFSDNNIWSSKLMLNMKSKITDGMKFGGRLSMYKYWADSTKHTLNNQDSMQGRIPSDSTLYVERAYIDWVLNKGSDVPVILTIGRQPSSDGPSYTFMDDTTRKSTYSALIFDGASDGVVATVALAKATGIDNTALRLAYFKQYQDDDNNPMNGTPFIGRDTNDDKNKNDSNVLGLFFDTSIPALPNSLLQFGYVSAKNMNIASTNIGDVSLFNASFEVQNIASLGLDFFAHYAMSNSKSNGNGIASYGNIGLLTNSPDDTETKKGNAIWLGTRYTLPNKGKIGLEYNKGSENWFSFTNAPHDTYNKLATRGTAVEAYYIQPINKFSFLRVGGVSMDYEYTGSGSPLGQPQKIDSDTKIMNNPVLDKLTNYYLQFNLLY